MRRASSLLLIAVFTSAWLALPAAGQAPERTADADQPKPEELLRKMADYLGDLAAFSCRVETSIHIEAKGIDNRMDSKMTVRLERPNRLAILLEQGVMGMTVVSDGKNHFQYVPMLNRYTVKEAPADFADFNASGESMGIGMGMSAVILPTSGEEFYKSLMEGVTESEYLGTEEVGGVRCHHCRFVQEQFSWDIWIEAGDRPLVHKVVPDMSKQFADAGGMFEDAKFEYSITLSDWNVAPKFTDADFAFDPPANAEKVDSLFEGLAGGQEEGPHPLLGEPAPPFKSVDLTDKPIDLATHLGKDVVMLDFWATWCGPCVQAMPEIDGVAEKFADRGLVFYAVNVAEDAETIKEFLKTSELEVPVAMDPDGSITQSYRADGIPQTVLIGKDGKVQVVHVGFGEGLAELLSSQVEDLLAGKDLATPVLQEAEKAAEERASEENEAATADESASEEP